MWAQTFRFQVFKQHAESIQNRKNHMGLKHNETQWHCISIDRQTVLQTENVTDNIHTFEAILKAFTALRVQKMYHK